MGALLRFLVLNAVSVIGAKLISEAADYAADRLFKNTKGQPGQADPVTAEAQQAPALDTHYCPRCGAFRIKGEPCNCGA